VLYIKQSIPHPLFLLLLPLAPETRAMHQTPKIHRSILLYLFAFAFYNQAHAIPKAYEGPANRSAYILQDISIEEKFGTLTGTVLTPCNTEYKGIAILENKASKNGTYFIAAAMKKKAASCTGWPSKKTISLKFLPNHLKTKLIAFPTKLKKGVWKPSDIHNTAISDKNGLNWQELHVVYKSKRHSPTLLQPNIENNGQVLRISTITKKSHIHKNKKFLLAKVPLSRTAKNRVIIGSEEVHSDIPRSFKLFSTKIHQAISRTSDGSTFTSVMPCGYVPLGVVLHKDQGKSTYSTAGYRDHRITTCKKKYEVFDIEMPMIAYKPGNMATFNPQSLPRDKEFKLVSPARIKWKNKNIFGDKTAYELAYKTFNTCESSIGTLFSLNKTETLHVGQVSQKRGSCKPAFKPQTTRIPAIWGSSWKGRAQRVVLGPS